jgi:hypothetical protein
MSKEGYDPNLEEMPEYIVQVMTDNNCYGTHEVTVEYD